MKMTSIYILFFISIVSSISIDIRYPQFFHQSLNDSAIEITEGKISGSFIAFINLINSTNLNLNEWILNTTDEDFKIQSNGISYSLITTQILDRERKNFYNFSINIQHLRSPFEKFSKSLLFRILDINDCTPTFNQTIYQTILIPNESTYSIQAFDCDEPFTENSRISYSLSNYQDLFHIDEFTGILKCIKNLNTYEKYELIVVAFDHGKPSLSSTTLVQIQLISSLKSENIQTKSWIHIEQTPENILILSGILAIFFVSISLFICLICCIKYKLKQKTDHEKISSSSLPLNDYQKTTIYDTINMYPNQYYLPVQQQQQTDVQIPSSSILSSSSTTSSPISTSDIPIKIGSDDGCYCSSDMSSEQSNNNLLLNPSKLLSSKRIQFNQTNHIDGVLQRFENLYDSQGIRTTTDHCASYV